MSVKHPKLPELFYYDGLRKDAELHNPILDDGDHEKADAVSRKVAKRLGLSDADIDALSGKTENVKHLREASREKYSEDEPRDEGGRWTDGGGSDSGSGSAAGESKPIPPEDTSSHGIHGLPSSVKVNDHLLQQAIDRGTYTISATEKPPGKYKSGPPRYHLTVTAKIPPGVKSFEQRPDRASPAYYNPKLADLQTFNPGEKYLERTQATPKAGLSTKIEPLPGDNIIYRGMRAEEYQKFQETGKIVSTGAYNMEGQEGLTYWATDPATAASYANGFAPWPHKATFENPAYVVATTMPKETRHVPGTGENEVGVGRPVDKSEIVGVWRGDVYEHLPGEADLVPTPEGHYELGGGSGASSSVVWQRADKEGKKQAGRRRIAWASAVAQSAVLLDKYSDDEPRDESGKWTDGGGDGGADSSSGGGSAPSGAYISPSPSEFIMARDKSTRQQYLSPIKPNDLTDHTLLTTQDKKVGAAIDPKGDLQNVFNNGGPKGAAADVVVAAIGDGARTLDCYDGRLPVYYHQFGFVETGRMKFDPAQAHGWDVKQHGQPDVVFMAWKGYINGGAEAAINRAKGPEKDWITNVESSHYVTDYDAAKAESRTLAKGTRNHRRDLAKQGSASDPTRDQPLAPAGGSARRPLNPKRRVDWAIARAQSEVLLNRTQKYSDDEPRDEGGRWTDGGGSDSGGSGGGSGGKPVAGFSPGFKTPATGLEFHHSDDVKKDWVAKSPVKTIDDVKRLAGDAQKSLTDVGRSIATKLGIELKDPGSKVKTDKGVQRVLDKAALPRYGSLAAVPDVARMTLMINHPGQSDTILAELAKHFEVAAEPWKLTHVGYADRAANVRLPNGMMGEIQMMEPTMAHAKSPDGGGGHDQYVISRETDPKIGTKPDAAKHEAANAKMREIYGKALDQLGPDWKALFGKGGNSPKSLRNSASSIT